MTGSSPPSWLVRARRAGGGTLDRQGAGHWEEGGGGGALGGEGGVGHWEEGGGVKEGGFGMTPWCDDLVCSGRRLLADRHSLPFPWTLSLRRRWCPSASHHPLTFLFLPALTFPLPFPFPSLGLSLRRPQCPSASSPPLLLQCTAVLSHPCTGGSHIAIRVRASCACSPPNLAAHALPRFPANPHVTCPLHSSRTHTATSDHRPHRTARLHRTAGPMPDRQSRRSFPRPAHRWDGGVARSPSASRVATATPQPDPRMPCRSRVVCCPLPNGAPHQPWGSQESNAGCRLLLGMSRVCVSGVIRLGEQGRGAGGGGGRPGAWAVQGGRQGSVRGGGGGAGGAPKVCVHKTARQHSFCCEFRFFPPMVTLVWRGPGGGVAQGLSIRLFAFGGAHWPPATAHSDPLWVRTCFGGVNGAPG